MSTVFADPTTGELRGSREYKRHVAAQAQDLLERVWQEVSEDYDVAPLTALTIAEKCVASALTAAIKERKDTLAEPFKPQQTRMSL